MAGVERYSPEQVGEALRQSAGIIAHAAVKLRCSRPTIMDYLRKYPALRDIQDEAKANAVDLAESNLLKGLKDGDKTYTIFTLKTLGRGRGYVEGREVGGPGGGPIPVEHQVRHIDEKALSQAERMTLIRVIRASKAIQSNVSAE